MPRTLFYNALMLGIAAAALAAVHRLSYQARGAELPDHAQDQRRRLGRAAERGAHLALCRQGAGLLRQALHRRQHRAVRRRPVADLAVAAAQGTAIVSVSDVSIGRGLKVQQIWGLAPRMPQAYMVQGGIKTAADLKGKRLSATGGGVGGFNWRMGREVLKSAGLTEADAQFIPSPTAGRLPGLIAGQIDGVALHPEDVFLAKQQKPTLNRWCSSSS